MVNGEEQLREAFAAESVLSGGEFFLPASTGSRVIETCISRHLAIIGIEVFNQSDGKLIPNLDLIADFSAILHESLIWSVVVSETAREAGVFLKRISEKDILLNFTVLSEAEVRELGKYPDRVSS